MTRTDLAQQTAAEHGMLAMIVAGLRNTLSWKLNGTDFSRKLSTLRFIFTSFERHLERVLTLEEFDGYMDLVLRQNPQMGGLLDELRDEHEQLRIQSVRLLHRFENEPPTTCDQFVSLSDDLTSLMSKLENHDKREFDVMQQAFTQDEGGES